MREITSDELKEILEAHMKWVESSGKEGAMADLDNTNLSNTNLRRATLSSAKLSGANLSSAKLNNANLSSANLYNANLSSANLSRATLRGTKLNYANLSRANLCRANLNNADLSYADLDYADLNYANLCGANLEKTILRNADLSGTDLSGGNLRGTNLNYANLHGINLNNANLSSAILNRANLYQTKLQSANLSNVKLRGANLGNASLSNANLCSANLDFASLTRTNLSNANLKDSILTSADLENADLTKADISGANIFHLKTHGWQIEGIKCTHVYNCPYEASEEELEMSRINFKEGEFEAKYKTMPTIELVLSGGLQPIDQYKMGHIINEANREFDAGLEISSMKKGFEGIEVMLEAKSDKNLEEIGHMIVREYKNRNLDSKLLAIIKKEKLLDTGVEGLDINNPDIAVAKVFSQLSEARVTIVNKGTIVIGNVKGTTLALGQGATATTIINNYANNKDEIDNTLEEFKKVVSDEVRQQVEALTKALNGKDEEKASGAWEKTKKMVAKTDEVVKTGETVVKLSRTAIKLYNKLEGLL